MLLFTVGLSFANPPPASDVFKLTAQAVDPNTFSLTWAIKPGFFLYKKRISILAPANSNVQIAPLHLLKGLKKTDARGKTELIYRHQVSIPVSLLSEEAGETLVDVHYQGCSDDGFCYPPVTQTFKLTIDNHLSLSQITIEAHQTTPSISPSTPSERDKLDQLFSTNNWGLILLSFFGFGLLLSFTPCVLPMIPVLSGIIIGHSKTMSARKAFFLSLSYVLSMSVTYALVGAVVALMGKNLQIAMQSPWAIGSFSLIFVLLSLAMFNVYELRLPVSWQAKLANLTRGQSSGHYLSAAIMGALSTLILSPCVTAPLIGVLGYIAQTGNVSLGSLTLFVLSLGMGTPLLMIGTSAGKWLPHAGRWMNTVKAFFGVLLLAVAIYLIDRILPSVFTMILWAGLTIFSGLYMGALTKSITIHEKCCQGIGIMLLMYGLLILIGASQGHTNPLQPLVTSTLLNEQEGDVLVIKTLPDAQKALANAKGSPVMLDFYADWCASCKVIEATTLRDPRIQKALEKFVVLKIDLTANDANTTALLTYFNVVAPPTFLFFNESGLELDRLRLVGEMSTKVFYEQLNHVLH